MESPQRPLSEESVSAADEKKQPWKYIGYKVFSRWLASDQTFFIMRRFATLNARVALALQDEIVEIEERLDRMDRLYSRRDHSVLINNGSFRADPFDKDNERRELITVVLPEKLARYNSFLNGYAQLVSRGTVDKHDVEAVRTWLNDVRPRAIDIREADYIDRDGDLVPIIPKSRSPFRKFLENIAILRAPVLRDIFSTVPPEDGIDISKEETRWVHHSRVDTLSTVVLSLLGLAMLIGPLWILNHLVDKNVKLGVISAFIFVFYGLVQIATPARVYEGLAAAAAYSAVLVVFLQNL